MSKFVESLRQAQGPTMIRVPELVEGVIKKRKRNGNKTNKMK